MPTNPFRTTLKTFTFAAALRHIKAHPASFSGTAVGRALLKLVKQGNTRRLRRYWSR